MTNYKYYSSLYKDIETKKLERRESLMSARLNMGGHERSHKLALCVTHCTYHYTVKDIFVGLWNESKYFILKQFNLNEKKKYKYDPLSLLPKRENQKYWFMHATSGDLSYEPYESGHESQYVFLERKKGLGLTITLKNFYDRIRILNRYFFSKELYSPMFFYAMIRNKEKLQRLTILIKFPQFKYRKTAKYAKYIKYPKGITEKKNYRVIPICSVELDGKKLKNNLKISKKPAKII